MGRNEIRVRIEEWIDERIGNRLSLIDWRVEILDRGIM